jgi:acyl-coenzyme A synthetase/AMP-(fatty) acid ligase
MTASRADGLALAALTRQAGVQGRRIEDAGRRVALERATRPLDPRTADRFAGASVLLRTPDQLSTALALLALDGLARRLILCPPDLEAGHVPEVARQGEVDLVIEEGVETENAPWGGRNGAALPAAGDRTPIATEWVLFTSGTTGRPKMAVHALDGLLGAVPQPTPDPPVWGTFYDIRRYGGLQMLLRALTGGGSMILSSPQEGTGAFLSRLAAAGATHVAGTPSHWRSALLAPEIRALAPRYARLSGEIADQGVLDRLKALFPDAAVVHAYASTEGGVGFEVGDGLEGFPASLLSAPSQGVEMRIRDGSLRVRSARTAVRFLDEGAPPLRDAEGFVDTGDLIEVGADGRCRFLGRRGGVINVGGLKVHPEEVEAVLNRQPGVRACRVHGRKSPLAGAVVAAEVAPEPGQDLAALALALKTACALALPRHKTPAVIRFVDVLDVTPSGKLRRSNA